MEASILAHDRLYVSIAYHNAIDTPNALHRGGVLDVLIFLSTHESTRRLRVRHGKRLVQR